MKRGEIERGDNNKNQMLCFWQGIACILVLQAHVVFPGKVGAGLIFLGRFSVGLFFAISGFFLTKSDWKVEKSVLVRKITKLLKYFIISFMVYLIYAIITNTFEFSWWRLYRLFIFNDTTLAVGVLWYLLASIYCYIVYAVLEKIFKENVLKVLFVISTISLIISYVIRIWAVVTANEQVYYDSLYMFRSWLFFGIPMFTLGLVLRKHEKYLKKITKNQAAVLLIIGFSFEIIETYIIKLNVEFYIGSIIVIIAIFMLSQQKNIKKNNAFFNYIIVIGQRYSLFIYLWHKLVMYIIEALIFTQIELDNKSVIKWTMPIIVFVITLLLAYLKDKIVHYVYIKKRNMSLTNK